MPYGEAQGLKGLGLDVNGLKLSSREDLRPNPLCFDELLAQIDQVIPSRSEAEVKRP